MLLRHALAQTRAPRVAPAKPLRSEAQANEALALPDARPSWVAPSPRALQGARQAQHAMQGARECARLFAWGAALALFLLPCLSFLNA